MTLPRKGLVAWLSGIILIAGVLPLVLYWPAFNVPVASELPSRELGVLTQWLVVISAFGVKPAYMVLSLAWIVCLWRCSAVDLVALRWGLICFLGGELACAANYLAYGGNSAITDYLHSYGMAVGFSFVAYAMLEGVDVRLVKYSPLKDRCAALSLCRACVKYTDAPCGLRRLFSFAIPALAVVALMLPSAEVQPVAYRMKVLDSFVEFQSPAWSQLFENRYCAWLALALLAVAWGTLTFKRDDPVGTSKLFLAAALGPLGFGLLRFFLRTAYRENLAWSNIWEEVTELLFVMAVGLVLWVFRGALFESEPRRQLAPNH